MRSHQLKLRLWRK